MIETAMLMTAGLGTRMRPYTDLTPKPLLPVLGIACAQWALDSLAKAGIRRVVANVHHLAHATAHGLSRLELHGMELVISDESTEILGSAGGLRQAEKLLGSAPFLYVNGDTICNLDIRALMLKHERLRSQWGVRLTMGVLPAAPGAGLYREIKLDARHGLITGLGEKKPGRPLFTGIAVIEPEVLATLPTGASDFVPTILEPAVRDQKAGAFVKDGFWFDIGSPELWLETHLSLIRLNERGALSSDWRKKIEAINRRVTDGVWVHHTAEPWLNNSGWTGPAYWFPGLGAPPEVLGPNSVIYGNSPTPLADRPGISYEGLWTATTF